MRRFKLFKSLFILPFLLLMLAGTGCNVQKDVFQKKKWKLKKGHPPIQRYYNKWTPFNPDKK